MSVTAVVAVFTAPLAALVAVSTSVGGSTGSDPPPGGVVVVCEVGAVAVVGVLLEGAVVSRPSSVGLAPGTSSRAGALASTLVSARGPAVREPVIAAGSSLLRVFAPPDRPGPAELSCDCWSVGTRTIVPAAATAGDSECPNGTSPAAMRSTVAGSGSERPRTAKTGTGRTTARTARSRAPSPRQRERMPGPDKWTSAAVMIEGGRALPKTIVGSGHSLATSEWVIAAVCLLKTVGLL
jgi:hypothetical protein